MEGANIPTFRPTLTVWPAEPPTLPPVVVPELRRIPEHPTAFTQWNPTRDGAATLALPEDFGLRECLATSPEDLEAVFAFVTRWGRLTPMEAHLRRPMDSLPASLDWLIPQLRDTAQRTALRRLTPDGGDAGTGGHDLRIEAHYLRVLRALVGHVVHARSGQPPSDGWRAEGFRKDPEPWGTFVITMNAALRPFSVHVRYPGAETLLDAPSTYETAVLQLAQLIAEDRHVRRCANERCHRLFTRQRGRAKYDNTGHATGVIYCSNLCAKAQAERVRRARKRAEATNHGAPDASP